MLAERGISANSACFSVLGDGLRMACHAFRTDNIQIRKVAMAKKKNNKNTGNNKNGGANIGFETELWRAADALRSNMDAAEYKHVVLGLIFLKYISDAFEEQRAGLEAEIAEGADPEDPNEYRAVNIFWVPREARWSNVQDSAKQAMIGKVLDDAMIAIERDNPSLKGVLPKEYAHPRIDKQRLGQLIDLIGDIGLGDEANRTKDILGRVYEYFLSQFASAEGKKGGQFYTPRCVVRAHASGNGNGGRAKGDISVFGQESNHTTWRLAKMNLAIRQIDNNLGKEHADGFHRELTDDDILKITDTYHAWRGDKYAGKYEDIPGFCKCATLDDIRSHGHILTPGRYVGAADVEDDGEPFDDKMTRLTAALREKTGKSGKLDEMIWANLEDVGYGG